MKPLVDLQKTFVIPKYHGIDKTIRMGVTITKAPWLLDVKALFRQTNYYHEKIVRIIDRNHLENV